MTHISKWSEELKGGDTTEEHSSGQVVKHENDSHARHYMSTGNVLTQCRRLKTGRRDKAIQMRTLLKRKLVATMISIVNHL